MDVIFRILNNFSSCLFCGKILTSHASHIKFCQDCCKNILFINDHLKLITKKNHHNVLETRLGIKSRRDFGKWAIHNHPDKGGNPEIFRKVLQLVDIKYPK